MGTTINQWEGRLSPLLPPRWVRLTSSTTQPYLSQGPSDEKTGAFVILDVASGVTYTLATGPSPGGPWTTEDSNYSVGFFAANPVSLKSNLRIYNVKTDYNASISLADNSANINAAITDANADGGGEVWLPAAYPILNPVVELTNVTLRAIGYGAGLINNQHGYSGGADVAEAITIGKGLSAIYAPTISDTGLRAASVVVSSATGIAPGDIIAIWDTFYAEVNQVASSYVGGTTVALAWPTRYDYKASRGAQIQKKAWVRNWKIENLRITGANDSGHAIAVFDALDGRILSPYCDSVGGRGVLLKNWAARNRVIDADIDTCGQVAGVPALETYVTTSDNEFLAPRVRNGKSHGIAMHGFHNKVTAPKVWGNATDGIHCDTGSDLVISDPEVSDNGNAGISVQGAGTDFTTNVRTIAITGGVVGQNAGDGIALGTSNASFCRPTVSGTHLDDNWVNLHLYASLVGFEIAGITMHGERAGATHIACESPPPDFGTLGVSTIDGAGTLISGSFGTSTQLVAPGRGINSVLTDQLVAAGLRSSADPTATAGQTGIGVTTGVGNGAGTNLTALAKGTGSGPASLQAVTWIKVTQGTNVGWVPFYQ